MKMETRQVSFENGVVRYGVLGSDIVVKDV